MTHKIQMLNRVNPGIDSSATEFFLVKEEVKIIQDSKVSNFCDISFENIKLLEDEINNNLNVKLELHDMHPNSQMKRLEQFAKCRFGGLDFQADIQDGKLQDGEYWNCPIQATCKSKGILCKLPSYNGHQLTDQDIKLMQLLSTPMTNDVIASEMKLPMGSFHKAHSKLYTKLGIQTKQEDTRICFSLNLIQV